MDKSLFRKLVYEFGFRAVAASCFFVTSASAQQEAATNVNAGSNAPVAWESIVSSLRDTGVGTSTLRTLTTLIAVAGVPAFMLMTTGFVRISVVLGLMRQALGPSLFLSNQVISALTLALTITVMAPIWRQSYREGIQPFLAKNPSVSTETAWQRGIEPVRRFMARQIEAADNARDVRLFLEYAEQAQDPPLSTSPTDLNEVPTAALLPAFLISELKVAFLIGVRVYLPFLMIDLIVASLTSVLGMAMLSPATVALPLKLVVFVMADGWHLIVESLLKSFGMN
jgi:flagellar biosynthetic protein FliP